MSLIAREPENASGDFTPAPEGTHIGVCCLVADVGTQDGEFGKKDQVILSWLLPDHPIGEEQLPMSTSRRYTNSLHERATLRQHLEAWRGKSFSDEELAGFDLRKIAGKPCTVSIIHKKRDDGRVYDKVNGVAQVPKSVKVDTKDVTPVTWEVEKAIAGEHPWDAVPKWVQNVAKESEQYKASQGIAQTVREETEASTAPSDDKEEDDIPF